MSDGLEGLLAGRTLVGRYRIEEVIGRGGFAVVYRAEDLRLARPVAVKVITPPTLDPDARERLRERFQREARAAASLPHHPNVVAIHDFGTDQDTGIDFLAMELLRGETLAQFLAREGRPPLDVALEIVREAADGLALGHRAGLIHRDLKPGNLFLAEPHGEGEQFRVCVLDFGIARLADAEDATLTRHDGIPLSPAYASPEQLRGARGLTPATDVYSLGLVAQELLSGRKVFTADRAGDQGQVPPPLGDDVPAPIRGVVQRALSADPGARYPDAGAFCAALEQAAAGHATPPSPAVPAMEDRTVIIPPARPAPARRRGTGSALLLAVPLLAVAGGVWALTRDGSDGPEPAPGIPAESVSAAEPASPLVEEAETEPETATSSADTGGAGRGGGDSSPRVAEPAPLEPGPVTAPIGDPSRPSPQQPTRPQPAAPEPRQEPAPVEQAPPPTQSPPQPQQPAPVQTEPVQPRPVEPQPVSPTPAPRDTIRIPVIPVLP